MFDQFFNIIIIVIGYEKDSLDISITHNTTLISLIPYYFLIKFIIWVIINLNFNLILHLIVLYINIKNNTLMLFLRLDIYFNIKIKIILIYFRLYILLYITKYKYLVFSRLNSLLLKLPRILRHKVPVIIFILNLVLTLSIIIESYHTIYNTNISLLYLHLKGFMQFHKQQLESLDEIDIIIDPILQLKQEQLYNIIIVEECSIIEQWACLKRSFNYLIYKKF